MKKNGCVRKKASRKAEGKSLAASKGQSRHLTLSRWHLRLAR